MTDSQTSDNGGPSPGPSHAQDYSAAFQQARLTGDFKFILQTAKESDGMLRNFHDAILHGIFKGRYSEPIAMGLRFLNSMIENSSRQLELLKQTEKATRAALKTAQENRGNPPPPPAP